MKKILFITGASGTGKTTAVKMLEKKHLPKVSFCYFDSIGVPSNEEMIQHFGSSKEWQKHTTREWVKKINEEYSDSDTVILDGQIRQSFIEEACSGEEIQEYKIILFDCSDEIRNRRLIERGQPELANDDMKKWAHYLRNEAIKREDYIIDTSQYAIGQAADELEKLI